MTLTEKDIDQIERIVDERLEQKFPNLSERIDKIWEMLVKFAGDLQTLTNEFKIMNHHFSGQEKRIDNIEKIHPRGQHTS